MIDLQDKSYSPTLDEIGEYVGNDVFDGFCSEIKEKYKINEKIEYSSCSMERGWNIKFKKAGKSLCTIYPRESYFTVLLVVGRKEKEPFEAERQGWTERMQDIYDQTPEGNGQKWLMVDLEDKDDLYRDVFRLIGIRRAG